MEHSNIPTLYSYEPIESYFRRELKHWAEIIGSNILEYEKPNIESIVSLKIFLRSKITRPYILTKSIPGDFALEN